MENAFESVVQQSYFNPEEFAAITQDYPIIKCRKRAVEDFKVKYMNPDNFNKQLSVESSESFVEIKTKTLKIDYKDSSYIRFKIIAPETVAFYECFIIIRDLRSNKVEELMKLSIEVLGEGEELE